MRGTPRPPCKVGLLVRSVVAWTKFCQSTLQGERGVASVRSLCPQPRHAVDCRHAFNWQNFVHPQYSVRKVIGFMKNAARAEGRRRCTRAGSCARAVRRRARGGGGLCRRFASLPEAGTDARLLSPSLETGAGHIRSPNGPYTNVHVPHTTVSSGLYAHADRLRVRMGSLGTAPGDRARLCGGRYGGRM